MKQRSLRTAVVLAAAVLISLNPSRARAEAYANSILAFTNFSVASAGTFQLLGSWESSAFAQAGLSNQFNSGPIASAAASGDYSTAGGTAVPSSPTSLDIFLFGLGNAFVPGQLEASDAAAGRGAVANQFMITGGSGSVSVDFFAAINGSLSVFTDVYGESADAETVFALQIDGSPVLFDSRVFSIGSNGGDGENFSALLNNSVMLQYNTVYQLYIEADAEAFVSNIPEPGAGGIFALALLIALFLWRKRSGRRISAGTQTSVSVLAAAMVILPATSSLALYIGADPPCVCEKCGPPPNRQNGGTVMTSLTEGNLREDYPVTSLQSGSGPTLQMAFTYNSYNADASRARVDSGLGLGWTHSYNIFLFMQRGSLFRMGPDGRVTLFRQSHGGTYTADSGFFETLTSLGGGNYAITNKEQSWWIFASVPNTPFQVGGPVYRLIQMGDRNTNVTSLTYSNGLLSLITDPYGRSLQLGYTNQNKLASVTDPLGRVTRLQYDARFRTPIRITDPAGNVARYTYNSQYQLTRKIDRDGRTYLYLYKSQKPYAVVDGNGQSWFAQSNTNNWAVNRNALALTLRRVYFPATVTNTDGNGNKWRYQYDTNGYITRLTAPDGTTTSYSYDSATRLLSSVTNANGAVTRYQYDTLGNRTNMTDALGNRTTYTYEPVFNQITSLTDPNGRTTVYQYDSRGNKTNEIDALGQTNRWTYDGRGNLLTQTDRNGHTTTYIYDSFGNRTNMTDALGNVTSYTYDAVGNRLSMLDPLGRVTTYAYDPLDRVVGATNALGGAITYTYDALGRQTRATDPLSRATTYGYDTRGRPTHTTNSIGGVSSSGYDANNNRTATTNELGQTTRFAYDSLNRLARATNALGGVSSSSYDAVGNATISVDANGHITSYQYDPLNRRVTMTDALGNVTKYDYASLGGAPCCNPTFGSSLITRLEDANGKVTFYKYDELDRLKQTIRKNGDTNDVIDADDAVTTTTYDAVGNRLSVTDPVTNTTVYAYDALNRQISMMNAAGDTTTMNYDAVGNVIRTVSPNGNATTNVYDALNRTTFVYDEIGGGATNTYDAIGNRLTTADALGHATMFSYDGLDRRITTTDPLGQTTTTAYDAAGNIVTNIDRNGHTTTYAYDSLNRRTTMTDALGNTTTTAYDPVGNVTSLTDANGNTTSYQYDPLDRRIVETYPDAPPNSRTNVYDAVGNLISRIDQKGQVTTYSYSDLYFMTNRAYLPSGANDAFTYDNAGRLLSASRGGWVDTFAYDGANRVTNTVQNGQAVHYSYDIPGRAQTNTYPSGRAINYAYDARTRLVSVHDGTLNPPIAIYTYDGADRVVTRAYRNNTTATYAYNANNWVTSLEHSNSLGRIAGFGYAYDNEGNKLYEEKRHNTADSEAYQHDALDRLVDYRVGTLVGPTVPAPMIAKTWNLDPVGNWNNVTSNSVPETRTHNNANELTSINTTNLLGYDGNGNLQQDPAYAYTYDEENRLTQVQRLSDAAVVGQYFYDALSRRVVKIANPAGISSTNLFFYDEARIVEEQNVAGVTIATYTYGNYIDEVLTMDRGGQVFYYHQNALWSPHALTESSGAAAERYSYDAYGGVIVMDASYAPLALNAWGTPHSAAANPFLFTGRQLDEETGIFFYRARYYDSIKGRFLQRDPLGYVDGMNLYEYVKSRPTRFTDPSGKAIVCGGFSGFAGFAIAISGSAYICSDNCVPSRRALVICVGGGGGAGASFGGGGTVGQGCLTPGWSTQLTLQGSVGPVGFSGSAGLSDPDVPLSGGASVGPSTAVAFAGTIERCYTRILPPAAPVRPPVRRDSPPAAPCCQCYSFGVKVQCTPGPCRWNSNLFPCRCGSGSVNQDDTGPCRGGVDCKR